MGEQYLDQAQIRAQTRAVRSLALTLVRDSTRADDVVQDTWMSALSNPPRHMGNFAGWMKALARRVVLRGQRAESRRAARDRQAAPPGNAEDPTDAIERAALQRIVLDAVFALDARSRTVVVLRFFEGLSAPEIARRLEMRPGAVRMRISRALDQLRGDLEKRLGRGARDWRDVLAPLVWPLAFRRPAPLVAGTSWGAWIAMGHLKFGVGVLLVVGAVILVWPTEAPERAYRSLRTGSAPRSADESLASSRSGSAREASVSDEAVETLAFRPRLSGRVVDADGRPVGGARVVACALRATELVMTTPAPAADIAAPHATTEEDGRFALLMDQGGGVRLIVEADGHPPASVPEAHAGDHVTVRLARGSRLVGRVSDREGRAVGGARVRYYAKHRVAVSVREATTASDGTYVIEGVPTERASGQVAIFDEPEELVVSAPGYAPAIVEEIARVEPRDVLRVDVVLRVGVTVRGVVVDAVTRRPIAGARVVLWTPQDVGPSRVPGPQDWDRRGFVLDRCRSGPEGRFRFDGVPTGGRAGAKVSARTTDHAVVSVPVAEGPSWGPEDGSRRQVTLAMPAACAVRGTVVDASGVPLGGVRVRVERCAGSKVFAAEVPGDWRRGIFEASTSSDGGFELVGFDGREGRFRLSVQGVLNLRAVHRTFTARPGRRVTLPPIVVDTRLPSATLRVQDDRGRPLEGALATLSLGPDSGPSWMGPHHQKTDASGRVRFLFPRGLDPERHFAASVGLEGFARARSVPFRPSLPEPPEVTVTLARGHRLRGRVRFADGGDVPYARLWVASARLPAGSPPPSRSALERLPPSMFHASTFVKGGRIDLRGLPPGPWDVAVAAIRDAPGSSVLLTGVAADTLDVEVVLQRPGPPPGSLRVRLRDVTGRRVLDATVIVSRGRALDWSKVPFGSGGLPMVTGAASAVARARADGDFVATRLTPGPWYVHVRSGWRVCRVDGPVEVPGGGDPILRELVLPDAPRWSGVVRVPGGHPLENARIELRPTGPGTRRAVAVVDPRGRFDVPDLEPGQRVHVVLRTDGQVYTEERFGSVVVPEPGSDWRLALVPAGVLDLRYHGPTFPATVRSSWIRVNRLGGGVTRRCGAREIVIPAGRYAVSWSKPSGEGGERVLEIEAGRPRVLVIP